MSIETVTFQPTKLVLATHISVSHHFIAQHRWAACPFEEQAFLRDWHRHVFHVRAHFSVHHDDRDLEFFRVQSTLTEICREWDGRQVEKSCEMFAASILQTLLELGYHASKVEVSEDGENSATVCALNVGVPFTVLEMPLPSTLEGYVQPVE